MRRQISKKDYTIKCEIVLNKISNSRSFNIQQVQDDVIEQPRGLTRRKSCYSQLFGYMNKFQNRYHNILPELKTKYCTQDKETKETYRRQTQIAEDTVIRKFRRGLQELTKCQTVIQTLKMLKNKNRNIQNFIKQMRTPNNKIVQEKTRRNSCFCSECGSQSQFQLTHQNDPYFNYFNYNEFLKRKIIDPKFNKFKNKLLSQIQLENMKKSFVNENKSQINKYKTVSRTTNLLLKLSSTKLSNQNQRQFSIQSKRVKTEFTQCSPKSFKQYSSQTTKYRKFVTYSNYQSMITNQTKDSFKSLASIYK